MRGQPGLWLWGVAIFSLFTALRVTAQVENYRESALEGHREFVKGATVGELELNLETLRGAREDHLRDYQRIAKTYDQSGGDAFIRSQMEDSAKSIKFDDAEIALSVEAIARKKRPKLDADVPPEDGLRPNNPPINWPPGDQAQSSTPGAAAITKAMYQTAPGATYKEIDCVGFVTKTLEKAGFRLDANIRQRISMSDVPEAEMAQLVAKNDRRMAGVAGALIDSGQATPITNVRLTKPGDFVQYYYWEKKLVLGGPKGVEMKDVFSGHAGIVEKSYGDGRVDLYGSHFSKGGVGRLEGLNLATKTGYIARPN